MSRFLCPASSPLLPQQPLSWVALLLFSVVQRASSGPAAAPPASRARPCFLGRSSRRLFFGRCCRIGKQARPWHEPAGGSWLVAGGRLSVALSRGAQERRCCGTEPMQTMQCTLQTDPSGPVRALSVPLRGGGDGHPLLTQLVRASPTACQEAERWIGAASSRRPDVRKSRLERSRRLRVCVRGGRRDAG